MARYTDESRERVRDAVDFAEVVGARTELKRAGIARLQGLCPFHDERSPSFGINPTEKVYYCFGCGAGGDVFKFVMDTEGLDFGAALESLAERYRVPLERESEDPRDAARRVARERLLALLERTAAYYVRVLWESPDAAGAREYLAGRGLEEGALRAFRVGFAPDAWDRVSVGSRRNGYSEDELIAAGLAQRARGGSGGLIDRFRGRITFPLADERGRVLGFGARAMTPEDKPKYLNTSESDLFHKGRIVYGADLARAAAARAGRVVLVEGYTDVIALHQAGVPEVVAQMGTALTDAQVDALARLAPKALFCQDPDRAGQESVAKGIASLRTHNKSRSTRGVEFRIVRLPVGEDPADVVQRSGAETMRSLLDDAIPIERFEVERALDQPGATTDEMLGAAALAIAGLSPSVLRDELVKLISGRLGLGEQLVNEALRSPLPSTPPRQAAAPRQASPQRGAAGPQRGGQGGRPAPEPGRPSRASAPPPVAAAPTNSAPVDPSRAEEPPPPEWDGFSGTEDTGPPPVWDDAGGASGSDAGGAAPNGFESATARGGTPHTGGGTPGGARPSPDDVADGGGGPDGGGATGGAGQRWNGQGVADPGWPGARDSGWNNARGGGRDWGPGRQPWTGRGERPRRPGGRDRYHSPAQPPEPADPRTVLVRREQSERAFLAYCLALPEEGERRLASVDVEDYFSTPATRQAATYLRGRLRAPTANLPSGDDGFARLIAQLVVSADTLEATNAKLELEALQLELHRLERHISSARITGATGVQALASERQRVLDEIRHRLQ